MYQSEWPITTQTKTCITVLSEYRGKCYQPQKSLPRRVLEKATSPNKQNEKRKKHVWLSGRLHIERRLNEGTRLQRKHKDEKRSKAVTNVTPEKNFMTCANQTPGEYKFVALVASQQGRANQHEPLALGYPLLGPSRHVRAFHCMPQSSLGFLCNDPFRHEMFRPLFLRSAPFPLVLGCSMYINCCGQITSGLARSATCKLVSDT